MKSARPSASADVSVIAVTVAERVDHLASGLIGHRDFDRAGDDEKDLARLIVAVKDNLVAREVARAHLARDRQAVGDSEAGEERALREEVGDPCRIHPA